MSIKRGQNTLGERGGIRFYLPLPGESVRIDRPTSDSLPSPPSSIRTGGRTVTSQRNFLGWLVYQSGMSLNLKTKSRDTVQPMRRRACVYQNIDPVIKNFHNSGRSRTDFKISLQYSSRFFLISKKTCDVREEEYYSLQGIIGVFELIPDRSQRSSWLHWHGLQDF